MNYLGAKFGKNINQNEPLSKQYAKFVYNLEGSDNPFKEIPSNIINTIPQNEEGGKHLSPSKIKFSPFGKALPQTQEKTQSFFDKTKSIFWSN